MGWVASEITTDRISFAGTALGNRRGFSSADVNDIRLELRNGNYVFILSGEFGVVGA